MPSTQPLELEESLTPESPSASASTIRGISPEQVRALRGNIPVLLLVANRHEYEAVLKRLKPLEGECLLAGNVGEETFVFGWYGAHRCAVLKCQTGSSTVTGSQAAVAHAIDTLAPQAIIALGIAFGKTPPDPSKAGGKAQAIGDVLISRQLILYEPGAADPGHYSPRGPHPEASTQLMSLLELAALHWTYVLPSGRAPSVEVGILLSGDKRINDPLFRAELFDRYPGAIGGEMEGSGLYASATRKDTQWIVVKAIADWAMDKLDEAQPAVADAAADLVFRALSLENAVSSPRSSASDGSSRSAAVRIALPREAFTVDLDRRSMIRTAAILGGAIVVAGGVRGIGTIIRTLQDAASEQKEAEGERKELLTELFGTQTRTILYPGAKHLYQRPAPSYEGRERPYPHEWSTLSAYTRSIEHDLVVHEGIYIETDDRRDDSWVCSGSPAANDRTALYLPVKMEDPKQRLDLPTPLIQQGALPYEFYMGAREEIYVRSGMHPGEIRRKRPHGLWMRQKSGIRTVWRPDGFAARHLEQSVGWQEFLAKDFLLVSRLPRPHSAGFVVSIAGGHGAGTQAFELLNDPSACPIDELRKLRETVRGWQFYQIVFEVAGMVHDPPMTLATSIHVPWLDCPPASVDVNDGRLWSTQPIMA